MDHRVVGQTDVDECTEAGHVRDHTFDDATFRDANRIGVAVQELGQVVAEARIATGEREFPHQITPRHLVELERLATQSLGGAGATETVLDRLAAALEQLAGDRVELGVQAGLVERLGGLRHTQETDRVGPLDLVQEALGTQLFAGGERLLGTTRQQRFDTIVVQSGNLTQHGGRRLVQHATGVRDGRFGRLVEHASQVGLADQALLGAQRQVPRIDLEQLGHRVLEAAAEADGSPLGHRAVRKLAATDLGVGVVRQSGFGGEHDDLTEAAGFERGAHRGDLGTRSTAVRNDQGAGGRVLEEGDELGTEGRGVLAFGLDATLGADVAFAVEAREDPIALRADVDTHGGVTALRRAEQDLAQVRTEEAQGFRVTALLEFEANVLLDHRQKARFEGPAGDLVEHFLERGIGPTPQRLAHLGQGDLGVQLDERIDRALLLGLADRDQAMALDLLERLVQLEQRLVTASLLGVDERTHAQGAALGHHLADLTSQARVATESVREDAHRSGERLDLGVNALVGVHERLAEASELRRHRDARGRARAVLAGNVRFDRDRVTTVLGRLGGLTRFRRNRVRGRRLFGPRGSFSRCRFRRRSFCRCSGCFDRGSFCGHGFDRRGLGCGRLGRRGFDGGLGSCDHFGRRPIRGVVLGRARFTCRLRHRLHELVRERIQTAIHRELHFGFGPAVRHEEVFELEAIHALGDRVDDGRRKALLTFERTQDGAATAVEFFELAAAQLEFADLAFGEAAGTGPATATDERRGQACIDTLLTSEGFEDGSSSQSISGLEPRCGVDVLRTR